MKCSRNFSTHDSFELSSIGDPAASAANGVGILKLSRNLARCECLRVTKPSSAAPVFTSTCSSWPRKAPIAPRKPSCRRKEAFISPFDQKWMEYDRLDIVNGWPRMKKPAKRIFDRPYRLALRYAICPML